MSNFFAEHLIGFATSNSPSIINNYEKNVFKPQSKEG